MSIVPASFRIGASRLLRLGALAVGLATLAAPAFAQAGLRVAVVDPASGQELAVVAPGSEITMAPGQTLTFRLFEGNAGRRRDRVAVPAGFGFGNNPTALSIVSSNPSNGEVTVRLGDASPGQRLHVGWRLNDTRRGADASNTGKIDIRVVGSSVTPTQEYYVPGYRSFGSQIDALVDAYYRGILLRDPDPSGGANYRQTVARGGYQGARQAAIDIANSDESRRLRAAPEQRLEALYQNLLGIDPNSVDARTWDSDLARIAHGDVAGVVARMVDSRAFQYRYGFYYGR